MIEQTSFRIGLLGLFGILALLVVLRNFYNIFDPVGLVLIGEAMGLFIVAVVTVYWLIPTEGGESVFYLTIQRK